MKPEKRLKRYKDFEKFFVNAKTIFAEYESNDERSKTLAAHYSLYTVPGGRDGGHDKRLVQVFYGNRPFDEVKEVKYDVNQSVPVMRTRFLTEQGACLQYQCVDSGRVICFLSPAKTENSAIEDGVVLDWINEPASLASGALPAKHWRYLSAYMHCTSLDGDPNWFDRWRVAWIKFVKRLVIDGKIKPQRVASSGLEILKFALTVGLSGFLLYAVTKWFPGPSSPTKVIVVGEVDNYARGRERQNQQLSAIATKVDSLGQQVQEIRNKLDEPQTSRKGLPKK